MWPSDGGFFSLIKIIKYLCHVGFAKRIRSK